MQDWQAILLNSAPSGEVQSSWHCKKFCCQSPLVLGGEATAVRQAVKPPGGICGCALARSLTRPDGIGHHEMDMNKYEL